MKRYAREPDADVWHWCPNCPDYPKTPAIVTTFTRPHEDKLCKECKMLEEKGEYKA